VAPAGAAFVRVAAMSSWTMAFGFWITGELFFLYTESSEQVQFQSSAAGGALVGGIIGYNLNTDKSKSKQRHR
jgi:hypothetical protein